MAALKCNISITILLVCLDYINEKYFSFHTLIWYTFPWEKVFGHQVFPYKRIEECWIIGSKKFECFPNMNSNMHVYWIPGKKV